MLELTPVTRLTEHGADAAEAEAWLRDLTSRTGEDDSFFSVNRYVFVARRS
jgi:hypothetical protein